MRRLLPWLLVLVPWVTPGAVLLLQRVPRHPSVLHLGGEWQWTPAAGEQLPVGALWRSVHLPGRFLAQGIDAAEFWMQREFELPEPATGNWTFVFGDTRAGLVRVFVNGLEASETGAFEVGQKADFSGLEAVGVPRALLRSGRNVLALRVSSTQRGYAGVLDRRLLLGPAEVLGRWSLQARQLDGFFRVAPILLIPLLTVLVLVVARVSDEVRDWRLAKLYAAMGGCVCVYLLAQSGLGLTGVLSLQQRSSIIPWTSVVMTWLFAEFNFELADRPDGSLAKGLRWVTAALLAYLWLAQIVFPTGVFNPEVWRVVAGWPMVMLLCVGAATCVHLWTHRDLWAALQTSAALSIVVVGLVDTMTDVGLTQLPRLVAMSMANVPLMSALLVVGSFFEWAERNRALSKALGAANADLDAAVVAAQEASRVKGEFLAKVSHELRTPLNAIVNVPEGLLEDFEGEGEARRYVGDAALAVRSLELVKRSGTELLGVVNQVLDFSKLEVGRMRLVVERVDLSPLVEEVAKAVEDFGKRRGITVTVGGEVSGVLEADREKVLQVLLNLGHNAVKFSADGARVALAVARVEGAVEFSVKDDGPGIAVEHQALIFEGFRQVEGGSTRRYGGAGLGLAIARRLTELHGGTLTVASAPGNGSVFCARFPARAAPPAQA
jgi:signal transduction histidine kinase